MKYGKMFSICGIIAGIIGIIAIIISSVLDSNFIWFSSYISDLALGPAAVLFNFGMIATGLFGIPFSFAIRTCIARYGGVIILLAAIALVGIGMFPTPHPLHWGASAIFFVLLAASEIIIGAEVRSKHVHAGPVMIAAGLATFVMLLFFSAVTEPAIAFIGLFGAVAMGAWIAKMR